MDYHKRVNFLDVINPDAPEGEKHLRAFIDAVHYGRKDPEPETMEFISDAFTSILRGENPKKALKLELKQGVKSASAKTKRLTEEVTIAVMVEEYLMQGMTKDEARQKVVDKKGISYKTVKRYCRKNESLAKCMIQWFKNNDAIGKNADKK